MYFDQRLKSTTLFAVAACGLIGAAATQAGDDPSPLFERPAPVTMLELAKRTVDGGAAVEVSDYAPGHYTGPLTPSPPHADLR